MKCEITDRDQRIDDFLLAKLSQEDAETFEIHLFGCPECFEELRLREQVVKLIKEERVTAAAFDMPHRSPAPQKSFLQSFFDFWRIRQNAWIYAGAAAMIIVLAVLSLFRRQDSLRSDADRFAESAYLESALRQTYRAAGVSVNVLSPVLSENFTGEIAFRWEIRKAGEDSSRTLVLKILNNKQETVHETIVAGNEYRLAKGILAPGLYYWTLEAQGNTLHLGKFFVNKPIQ
jgi:hypothetical protein